MALKVVPGPVPSDGQRIDVQQVMQAYVEGTTITNFGIEDVTRGDSDIKVVVSQTDAPATDSRSRATLWFARGEGKLYKWTYYPNRSGLWSPSVAGSGVTVGVWLAITDRRDAIARCRWGWSQGMKLNCNTKTSEWKFEISEPDDTEHRYTPILCSTAGTGNPAGVGEDFADARFFTLAAMIDPTYVALTDAVDGEYAPVCDHGFVDALVEGPGANGTEPVMGYHSANHDPHYRCYSTNYSGWNNVSARVWFVAESAPSNVEQKIKVFMMPSISNMVMPGITVTELFSDP